MTRRAAVVLAFCFLALAVIRWRRGEPAGVYPLLIPRTVERAFRGRAIAPGVEGLAARDPFRLANRPARVRYFAGEAGDPLCRRRP